MEPLFLNKIISQQKCRTSRWSSFPLVRRMGDSPVLPTTSPPTNYVGLWVLKEGCCFIKDHNSKPVRLLFLRPKYPLTLPQARVVSSRRQLWLASLGLVDERIKFCFALLWTITIPLGQNYMNLRFFQTSPYITLLLTIYFHLLDFIINQ